MATLAKQGIFIVGAKRTPFGAFGGSLKALTATDLAVHSSKAAIAHAKIDPKKIDETIFGNNLNDNIFCYSPVGNSLNRILSPTR